MKLVGALDLFTKETKMTDYENRSHHNDDCEDDEFNAHSKWHWWKNHPKDCICFTEDTLIETKDGNKFIQEIFEGDEVLTDIGYQPVKWNGNRIVMLSSSQDNLFPVVIKANTFGDGLPNMDLSVSQQHRVKVDDFLVPAKALLDNDNVYIDYLLDYEIYYHLLFDTHRMVKANGHWCESLFLGKQAKKFLTEEQKNEISIVVPDLKMDDVHPLQMLKVGEWRKYEKSRNS